RAAEWCDGMTDRADASLLQTLDQLLLLRDERVDLGGLAVEVVGDRSLLRERSDGDRQLRQSRPTAKIGPTFTNPPRESLRVSRTGLQADRVCDKPSIDGGRRFAYRAHGRDRAV